MEKSHEIKPKKKTNNELVCLLAPPFFSVLSSLNV